MKPAFLDKLIERLDKLDHSSVHATFLRLTREKGLLEAIFNTVQEGILVLDSNAIIQYANSSAAQMLGFDPENQPQMPVGRFLHEIDWDRAMAMDDTEWSGMLGREIEITYPKHRFLRFYITPLLHEDGRERGAAVILRDITADREREMQTLQSDQINTLTLLAAGVAHEIGNPLNSLHIHLQLIEREIEGIESTAQESLRELLKVSRQEVERLNTTITQFLRAVRPTPPQMEPIRMEAVLQETLEFMKHEVENRDVLVEIRAHKPTPPISADHNQIKQAFFNIIKNAIQAMAHGGLLTIEVSANDRHVLVSFSDTGSGIPPENISGLFEPFNSSKSSGSGMGLMIVQRILRNHGGGIEIQSRRPSGTTVTISLPLDSRRVRLLKAPPKPRPELLK